MFEVDQNVGYAQINMCAVFIVLTMQIKMGQHILSSGIFDIQSEILWENDGREYCHESDH